jgi:hypothetical protein
MQGSIAQAAGLVIAGNAFLKGRDLKSYWPDSKDFLFCKSITFREIESGRAGAIYSENPISWFQKLKDGGILNLRLHYIVGKDPREARSTVGFVGGGGRWIIATETLDLSNLWEGVWEIGNQQDPERKIWNVTYYNLARIKLQEAASTNLALRHKELSDLLPLLIEFSERLNYRSDFIESFRKALSSLSNPHPSSIPQHYDLGYDEILSLEAQHVLAAVQSAWVFGGMGSWNDGAAFQGVSIKPTDADNEIHEKLSSQLFNILTGSVVDVANSSYA